MGEDDKVVDGVGGESGDRWDVGVIPDSGGNAGVGGEDDGVGGDARGCLQRWRGGRQGVVTVGDEDDGMTGGRYEHVSGSGLL